MAIGLVTVNVASAPPASAASFVKIVFAKGSFCGNYTGKIGSGKTFRMGLSADQTLTIRTLNGNHTIAWVKGPTGYLDGSKPDDESTEYFTEAKGWYYVRITAVVGRGDVQFCAE